MSYSVFLSRPAEKDLQRLPKSDRQRCADAIWALGDDPRPPGCQKLVDREGYRIRVGIYRIVYDVDDAAEEVTVHAIRHRKDAYR